MTDDDKALVERLRALHVWPQAVADDHADLLTPRQIDKLYEVGRVSHEAADRIEALEAENERLREALQWMVDNDETNEGDEPIEELGGKSWDEINAYWIDGLNRARAALAGDSHD